MHFVGRLFRVVDVVWQHEPLSGRGAGLFGGRFNAKGQDCFYTSLHYEIALREATQGIGDIEPVTVFSYAADIDNVLDLSSPGKIADFGASPAILRSPNWRDEMDRYGKSQSQEVAESVMTAGHPGMLVPSFAPGAREGDTNLVLWTWGADLPSKLVLNDPSNRLGRITAPPSPAV
jgi:RES domain-containing protein